MHIKSRKHSETEIYGSPLFEDMMFKRAAASAASYGHALCCEYVAYFRDVMFFYELCGSCLESLGACNMIFMHLFGLSSSDSSKVMAGVPGLQSSLWPGS